MWHIDVYIYKFIYKEVYFKTGNKMKFPYVEQTHGITQLCTTK